ncbi:MAG: Holliday junction branch migration protein RuvA [Acidobacteriaceae bacterium]|nr:Holliday junction branch migration protein RuvA [Acidobacteriaceae bacterium]
MIAHLRGTIFEKHPNQVVIEASGVGYDVQIPISTYTSLGDIGTSVSLRIHTHVREDALLLYGFASAEEKALFERLISVSGIGPKLAITVLSGLATRDLIESIHTGDVLRLTRIPGVGKKTAERIVLELKDKVAAVMDGGGKTDTRAEPSGPVLNSLDRDVVSALQNLGCARPAAEEAVRKARLKGTEENFEPLFRAAMALIR